VSGINGLLNPARRVKSKIEINPREFGRTGIKKDFRPYLGSRGSAINEVMRAVEIDVNQVVNNRHGERERKVAKN